MTNKNLAQEYADTLADGLEEHGFNDPDSGYSNVGDYLEDILDIEIITGINGEYRGAELALTIGGPNAFWNTRNSEIWVVWGGQKGSRTVPRRLSEELDSYLEELDEYLHDYLSLPK